MRAEHDSRDMAQPGWAVHALHSLRAQVIHDTLAAMGAGTEQVTDQVTEHVQRLLGVMKNQPASAQKLMSLLRLRHRPNLTATYLDPALAAGRSP